MRDEFLPFGRPLLGEEEIAEVVDTLRSGWITTGPKVKRFERMLEDYTGAPHVRCVSSCTAALTLALHANGIGPGDEVIAPAMTFVATLNAIEDVGATPVLVDCEPGTGLMDLDAAEAAVGPATRAMMPVHLAGRPFDMDRLNGLRDRHGVVVIEDAAHALGASWRDTPVGRWGNSAAFSFYATKNLTTGEGGALATDDEQLAAEVECLALHGLSLGAWSRFSSAGFRHFEVHRPGLKANMTDISAALGLHQLPRLDGWILERARQAGRYDALLEGLPVTTPPPADPRARHAWHLYSVLVDPDAPMGRDDLIEFLREQRIGTGVHYRGVHLHPYYRDRYAPEPGAFPVASDISARTISLPLGPGVTEADQDDVVAALRAALDARRPAAVPVAGARV
jgi:dTDP-4-amino-4,6-dideoxygalactose transaminase